MGYKVDTFVVDEELSLRADEIADKLNGELEEEEEEEEEDDDEGFKEVGPTTSTCSTL